VDCNLDATSTIGFRPNANWLGRLVQRRRRAERAPGSQREFTLRQEIYKGPLDLIARGVLANEPTRFRIFHARRCSYLLPALEPEGCANDPTHFFA
jgi:hypothetical protein